MKSLFQNLPVSLLLLLACAQPAFAGGVVSTPTEAALRAALAGGGTVTFACDGTITLAIPLSITNGTTLDATGHSIVLSGSNAVQVLVVSNNVTLNLLNLTVANGLNQGTNGGVNPSGPGVGGGIWTAGTVNLTGCVLQTNMAVGGNSAFASFHQGGGPGFGGGVYMAGGALNATNSIFIGNSATGGAGTNQNPSPVTNGGNGVGGAIFNNGGTINLVNCQFTQNTANGGMPGSDNFGDSGAIGGAFGGALVNLNGTCAIVSCSFQGNSALGTLPPQAPQFTEMGSGSTVGGGAIDNSNGVLTVTGTVFVSNNAAGGTAARIGSSGPGLGGAIFNCGTLGTTNCTFSANTATGGEGGMQGQDGQGGALYNSGSASVLNCTFSGNQAVGMDANQGGEFSYYPDGMGWGGAVYSGSNFVAQGSTFSGNIAQGSMGGTGNFGVYLGTNAYGGALFSSGPCFLTNNTFASNTAAGGLNGVGAAGNAYGGAFCNGGGSASLAYNTFAGNSAQAGTGSPNGTGSGGAIYSTNGTVTLIGNILAYSISGSNGFGTFTDAGHNLSSDSSCAFGGSGSLNSTDPKLGPLGNYGGSTLTYTLLAGSPAIDAGDNSSFPPTDQRGHARPYGSTPDIGSYEFSPPFLIEGLIFGNTFATEASVGDGTGSVPTTNHGNYVLTGLSAGTYTVTPVSPSYVFVPASQAITVGPDQAGVNFKAYRWQTFDLEGYSNGVLHSIFAASNGLSYRLLFSSDLMHWSPVLTNVVGSSNYLEFFLSTTNGKKGFYREVTP